MLLSGIPLESEATFDGGQLRHLRPRLPHLLPRKVDTIAVAAKPFEIKLFDHIIVCKQAHASLKGLGLF